MTNTYELSTIRDIFDKVPSDRIQDCCRELGTLLAQSKALAELVRVTADTMGIDENEPLMKMPESFTWVDDGKGEIVTRVCSGEDNELMRLESRPATE